MSAVRANSQNARILRALGDGQWKSTAAIHRRAGFSRLNSRISELRRYGYEIEHETIKGKVGALGHRYRLHNPPSPAELAAIIDPSRYVIPSETVTPRDSEHRFRLYRLVYDELELVGTAATPEGVGVAIVRLGSAGVFARSCIGLLDTRGTDQEPGSWIVQPFDTTP